MARRRTELVKADAGTDLLVPEAAGAGTLEIHRGTEIVESPGGPPAERPEDVLAQPPDACDVSAELAAPPRRPLPWLTLVLSACVVAAGAFTGGALVEKSHLHDTSGSRAGSFAATAGRTGRAGATGGGFGGGTGSGATAGGRTGTGSGSGTGTGTSGSGVTFGTVKLVDGSTIYVTDMRGDIVKVTTGGSTKVTESKEGKVSDLKPGQSVTVRGTSTADGGIAATTVTQGQAAGGGFGGFGGGFPGAGGSGGSGGGTGGGSGTAGGSGGTGGGAGGGN